MPKSCKPNSRMKYLRVQPPPHLHLIQLQGLALSPHLSPLSNFHLSSMSLAEGLWGENNLRCQVCRVVPVTWRQNSLKHTHTHTLTCTRVVHVHRLIYSDNPSDPLVFIILAIVLVLSRFLAPLSISIFPCKDQCSEIHLQIESVVNILHIFAIYLSVLFISGLLLWPPPQSLFCCQISPDLLRHGLY